MPNYIVNTAQFNPIDFESRIKPMQDYIEIYNKQMDALDEAAITGDTIGGLIDRNDERNKDLIATYDSYNNLLNSTVNDMISSGNLNASRANLSALRKKFANDLVPIKEGYTNWQKAIESYDQQKAKDPTFIGTNPREYSISNYMRGNSPQDYSVSGQTLYSMGASDAKAASARNKMYTEWGLDPNLAGQYFTRALVEGWSQDELASALKNEIIAQRGSAPSNTDLKGVAGYLYDAYNRIAKTTGIDNFSDDDLYSQAGGYILNGIISGIGYDIKDEKANNENFLNPLERARLEGELLDNEYKRVRNKQAETPTQIKSESSYTKGDFIVGDEIVLDKKAFNDAARDEEYASSIIENPYVEGTYTTSEMLTLESQLNNLKKEFEDSNNFSVIKTDDIPFNKTLGTSGAQSLATSMQPSARTLSYKYDSNGNRIGAASGRELAEYEKYQQSIKELQKKIDKESEKLSKTLEKYSYLKSSGMSISEAINYGANLAQQNAGKRSITRTINAASSDFTNETQRMQQLISETSDSNFTELDGGKISDKKLYDKIKGTSSSDILSIEESLDNVTGNYGYIVKTKDMPKGFIVSPSSSSYMNHSTLLNSARTTLSDYSPETTSKLREFDGPTEAILGVSRDNLDVVNNRSGGNSEIKRLQDNLFVISYKDVTRGPSKVVIEIDPSTNTPSIVGYTDISDFVTDKNGMMQVLGAISDTNFSNLTEK